MMARHGVGIYPAVELGATEVPFYKWANSEGLYKSIAEADRAIAAGAMEYVPASRIDEVLEYSTIHPHNQREGFQGGLPEPLSWRLWAVRVGATARCGARDCGLRWLEGVRAKHRPSSLPRSAPVLFACSLAERSGAADN